MLDSINHMMLNYLVHLSNHVFSLKTSRFCHIYMALLWASV